MPTLCAYVYVYVLMFECVCERHHAHITIERLPRQLLPRCLQCHLEYGRRRINTCPIFPQSPPIRIGPRTSTGSVAAGWHGLALLQLLPLVSNKHMISLSLSHMTSQLFLQLSIPRRKNRRNHLFETPTITARGHQGWPALKEKPLHSVLSQGVPVPPESPIGL